jgi:hypothetical protein
MKYPVMCEGMVKPELVHFNRVVRTLAVMDHFKVAGQRAATLEELLVFAQPWEFPVVALGSFWAFEHERHLVPYLLSNGTTRVRGSGPSRDLLPVLSRLELRWEEYSWHRDYRFLVFPK